MKTSLGNKKVFSANLNFYMKKFGKSRNEMCDALGFSYSTFSQWANGTKYPRIDKIEILANYFGILKSDLIEERIEKKYDGMYSYDEIGAIIRQKRIEKGLTQAQLGEIVGCSANTIAKWEKGLIERMTRETVQDLAAALSISPLNLIGFSFEETERSERKEKHLMRWNEQFGDVDFTDDEITEIINYAHFVISKRPQENNKK